MKSWFGRIKQGQISFPELFSLSAAEATVFPIPLELFLFPIMQLNRSRIWTLAWAALLGGLFGALILYTVAMLAMDTIGQSLIEKFGWSERTTSFETLFSTYGFWAIVLAGILPIPLQLAMLAAGAASYPLVMFCIAIALSRGVRYFGIAWLVRHYGNVAADVWRTNKLRFVFIALAALAGFWLFTLALQAVFSVQ